MAKLREYAAKRSFHATPEPPPEEAAVGEGPLMFVIQQHRASRMHYDFRLECDGVLKSWAVPKGPSLDPADKRMAVLVEDHPFDYGSFEGVIPPRQYGAGEVIVWDCGVYSPDEDGPWFHDREQAQQRVRAGLEAGKLSLQLRGEKLKGSFALVRTREAKSWLLIKHKDRFVSKEDVTAQDRSVLCGASVAEMRLVPVHRLPAQRLVPRGPRTPMPGKVEPMLAELAPDVFNSDDWMWEPKLDGYRVMAFVDADGVRLRSRRGLEIAGTFPRLAAQLREQASGGVVLDGELVAFDAAGKPSFNALQNRFQLKNERDIAAADRATPTLFFAFDLLHYEGIDLRRMPYRDRRRYLAQCLLPGPLVHLVHAVDDGVALNIAALASGFEGVIGKKKDSRYEAGRRSPAWIKVKPRRTADFVIGGYTRGKGSREALGSLIVGYWNDGHLVCASHVGSGLDERTLASLRKRLEPLHTRSCPFDPKPAVNGPVTWVKPELVAEVSYHEWTGDGALRAPVFERLREDINPRAVVRVDQEAPAVERPAYVETPARRATGARNGNGDAHAAGEGSGSAKPRARGAAGAAQSQAIGSVLQQLENPRNALGLEVGPHRIALSHLDREYWPAYPALHQPAQTKRDLLRYLAQVSPLMLPHLADRPLTMIRMPDGIDGQRFFQKHWAQKRPEFVETVTVFSSSKEEDHEYLLCNNLPTLLWLAQSGTLEFHVWHSRAAPGPDAATQSTDYASSEQSMDASVLNYPDYVIFDIDPYIYSGKEAPGDEPELNTVAFEKGKQIAFALREVLQGMSLEPIVKTSGKTGLHVFVPIRRTLDFDGARHVSELVSRHLMRQYPKDITMEWSVSKRTGKIFMDHNMNVRGKTLNVAYSPRGAPGAPVSMPLAWDELAHAHPLDFRMANVLKQLSRTGDRWRDALSRKQDLAKALGSGGA